jgi:hypothetical protein
VRLVGLGIGTMRRSDLNGHRSNECQMISNFRKLKTRAVRVFAERP